ncbi:hypothetical protein B0A50_05786 [Salinomyces thailandicus]|uniref:14-3-3 domain-containing protein n=1 Tax=Salinomyces thailandicus TaxID=706561 RepID=A0A4U0TTS4_9PEZI|nr:hypothetical protein B0A50_05786 [Salinomyces thailandica]
MAVSHIEEKILGRLARAAEPSNPLLSASLYQVLGLSILLSRKLYRARRLRKLDITRDTKSLQLHHQIIWLAREGLSITEVYILPYCQDGAQGPECRVVAAKLRASLYHVFCLFHNHPPINSASPQSGKSRSTSSSGRTVKAKNGISQSSPKRSPRQSKEGDETRRRAGKPVFRDPIPSMTSDTSYVTNPFAGPAQTPPPAGPPPPIPIEARRTPTRPPGLTPINISPQRAAASFLLPPLNFVPMAKEHFDTAQHLATSLLAPAHALRLSVSLEHAAFLWDCEKDFELAKKIARQAIKDVYASTEGLDDDEFADTSALVQALGGVVRRGGSNTNAALREPANHQPSWSSSSASRQPVSHAPKIDRAIAVSPTAAATTTKPNPKANARARPRPQIERDKLIPTPDRLSTVPEVSSTDAISEAPPTPPISRPNNVRSSNSKNRPHRRPCSATSATSTTSDKAAKRRALEQAEEDLHRQNSSAASNKKGSGSISSAKNRQAAPQLSEGYVRRPLPLPSPRSSSSSRRCNGG